MPSGPASGIRLTAIGSAGDGPARLRAFYETLYMAEFPNPHERESLDNMLEYLRLRERGWYGPNNYHVILADDGGQTCGGVIVTYLHEPQTGVIEFLCVGGSHRGRGLGRLILGAAEAAMQADALRGGGRLRFAVAEMNDPLRTVPASDSMPPALRARIWQRWGFRRLDFPYVQPALSGIQAPVRTLCLIARPQAAPPPDAMEAGRLRCILRGYMRWAMRIEQPETNAEYREMAAALAGRQGIALLPLAPQDAA